MGTEPRGDADADDPQGVVLHVVPWDDPVLDARGVDPRSAYVERCWLGVLGPTATLLLRHLATRLERAPKGFDLDLALTARSLGLTPRDGKNAPFRRALTRCARFGMVRLLPGGTLAVRRRVGPVPERHLVRLPAEIQVLHRRLTAATANPVCTR